ncbi:hypothetical protein EJ05DRAFT_530236 [Pseudovirgaria hyperparasitica]|uniref:PH domain-containing protein n=1 Tax=Pseudovirgaria hyperparasitica TaxID=470096 RepID=A0A6A6WMS3_9PEZI|nr:uncharacterized protein EJ05DRAFT_530236 [Pseudovirgaria hyperparasitica]KAF2763515.1 hypothetical protein EJ05DRAFT_530236 [Pseudovirgaria hyperparasitica]
MASTANQGPIAHNNDPFVSNPTDTHRHRYAAFDASSFSLYTNGSTSQAKRALEAHLAETERRLQETSQLGTVLVQQRKELGDRLKEVEQQADENEIGPELRKKLVELERECNEVSKDTARTFVPKSRVPSGETDAHTGGATVFSNDATPSPSKITAPSSRKQRNQHASRVHDIKLATEISSSLLQQLRELQAVLAEKDDTLRTIDTEKSKLEVEVEGLNQRLRAMDESEQRYKDENWSLETQVHDYITTSKESADREQRLSLTLNSIKSEKSSLERELEELKQAHSKLFDDQHSSRKQHESELTTLRRNVSRKIEELTSQNQELARAVSDSTSETEDVDVEHTTPDHSPPPSPSKATPRHGQLEHETLKSSLSHAHRMIQQLKNNIHREKTEKMELKRLLQGTRDELDQRTATDSASKRRKGKDAEVFKKPARPDRLGVQRNSREEIYVDEPDWEDHDGQDSPTRRRVSKTMAGTYPSTDTGTDAFETATETSDEFETANELEGAATETDAFHTGAETLDGDSSDDLTETEGTTTAGTVRHKRPGAAPLTSGRPGDRSSYMSTASTSADEPDQYSEVKTPVQSTQPKYRLKINRRGSRKTTPNRSSDDAVNSPASFKDSPASFISTGSQQGAPAGQSLFAELGDLSAEESEDDDVLGPDATPSRSTIISPESSQENLRKSVVETSRSASVAPKVAMVDSAMMTDSGETERGGIISNATSAVGAAIAGGVGFALGRGSENKTEDASRVMEPIMADQEEIVVLDMEPTALRISSISSQSSKPLAPVVHPNAALQHTISNVRSLQTEPIEAPKTQPSPLGISQVSAGQQIEPTATKSVPLGMSSIQPYHESAPSQQSESANVGPVAVPIEFIDKPSLSFSTIASQHVEPVNSTRSSKVISGGATTTSVVGVGTAGALLGAAATSEKATESESEPSAEPKSAGGYLGSMLRWRTSQRDPEAAGDMTKESLQQDDASPRVDYEEIPSHDREPFKVRNVNAGSKGQSGNSDPLPSSKIQSIIMSDEETQTSLSAQEIDKMLKVKQMPPSVIVPSPPSKTLTTHVRSNSSSPRKSYPPTSLVVDTGKTQPRRPGSAGSLRSRAATPPPLPPDHKEVIAAARTSIAASAYKKEQVRPRTPNVQMGIPSTVTSPSRSGTTPRARAPTIRSELSVPSTRRSSISSFASEIDQRFNIPRATLGDHFDPNTTDPRMIQAITQTMIGEYLWKYTRKAGRGEMSEKRHRRFFWVHPYTRTLYWSEQDPSTAGRAQLKAKSVAIEAVQVVTDDNPMPPGLHRKSIIVITPGRSVKFTATTGQRHETWFNALSYLLLRTNAERADEDDNITAEDINEFNPGYTRSPSRQTGRSRVSMASSHTNGNRNLSPSRAQYPTLTSRGAPGTQRVTSAQSGSQVPQNSVSSRFSSISGIFRPGSGMRGSFAGRRSRSSVRDSSLYDATTVHDSAEDLRQVIEQQERDADRLENVRACCDGKHDVGSLSRNGRHSSAQGRHTSFSSMTRRHTR